MRRVWVTGLGLFLVMVALGFSPQDDEDLQRNRRLLDRWRTQPDHALRLQRDLRAFYALPAKRQEQMRHLDRVLHSGDLTSQIRLWAVLDRYANWLEKLPEEQRRRVLAESEPQARLQLIREMRWNESLQRVPLRVREEILKLPKEKQAENLRAWREEERSYRRQWTKQTLALQDPPIKPATLEQLPVDVRKFVESNLLPRLSERDKQTLEKAKGKWPDYVKTIREMSDAYPVLPPLRSGPIVKIQDLPTEVRKHVEKFPAKRQQKLKQSEGAWPDFALEVVRTVKAETTRLSPLGASRPEEFPEEVRIFIRDRLPKGMQIQLAKSEGLWPDYPQALLRMTRAARMIVPGMSVPWPGELYDHVARAPSPEVSDRQLYQWVRDELTPETHQEMALDEKDPMGNREKIRKAFLREKIEEERARGRAKAMLSK
jgi:hypothetical protein